MTIQAKRLKQALKDAGIIEHGKIPSVRTRRIERNIQGERFTEFGLATATVWKRYATKKQIERLRQDSRVDIYLETENCLYLES